MDLQLRKDWADMKIHINIKYQIIAQYNMIYKNISRYTHSISVVGMSSLVCTVHNWDSVLTTVWKALKAWEKLVQTYPTLMTSWEWLSSRCHQDTFLISFSQNPTSKFPKSDLSHPESSNWIREQQNLTWSFGLGLSESKSIS